jgi:hypothetical protein
MLDALLANLLSGVKEEAPAAPAAAVAPKEPAPAPARAADPKPSVPSDAASEQVPPILKLTQDLAQKTAPAPVSPTLPRRVVWQLYCQGDGKLYYHADKAYLERWVAERNALYASAKAALQTAPRTFYSTAPGFGFQAGGCAGRSCGTR